MEFRTQKFMDKDGKMFHTGLGDGDIAETVLLPGDLGRSKIIANFFKDAEYKGRRRTFVSYTGKTPNDGVPISVVSSGMGCMAAGVAMEEFKHLGVKKMSLGSAQGLPFSGIINPVQ